MPPTKVIHYLERSTEQCDEFYEITLTEGKETVAVRAGYVGYWVPEDSLWFPDFETARSSAEAILSQKLAEGFVQATKGDRPRRDYPTITLQEWVLEFVSFYRQLGFFQNYGQFSDAELAEQILMYGDGDFDHPDSFPEIYELADDLDSLENFFSKEQFLIEEGTQTFVGINPLISNQTTDLRLLSLLDPGRVWWRWRDFGENSYPGPESVDYQELLLQLSRISKGSFIVRDINQTESNGVISIRFAEGSYLHQLTANQRVIQPTDEESQIAPDLNILVQINALPCLQNSGLRFIAFEILNRGGDGCIHYYPFNNTDYIIVLSPTDMQRIEQERRWKFPA